MIGGEIVHIHPFYLLQKSISEIVMDIRLIRNEYETDEFHIDDFLIILPVSFHSFIPLKRAYWENPSFSYDANSRSDAFSQILDYAALYRILVTPTLTENNEEVFSAAIPLLKDSSQKNIELFMNYSDFPVDETAKFAALYEPQSIFELEWRDIKTPRDIKHLDDYKN